MHVLQAPCVRQPSAYAPHQSPPIHGVLRKKRFIVTKAPRARTTRTTRVLPLLLTRQPQTSFPAPVRALLPVGFDRLLPLDSLVWTRLLLDRQFTPSVTPSPETTFRLAEKKRRYSDPVHGLFMPESALVHSSTSRSHLEFPAGNQHESQARLLVDCLPKALPVPPPVSPTREFRLTHESPCRFRLVDTDRLFPGFTCPVFVSRIRACSCRQASKHRRAQHHHVE
jgi:hypothetical protein